MVIMVDESRDHQRFGPTNKTVFLFVYLFVCLFGVFRSTQEFFHSYGEVTITGEGM